MASVVPSTRGRGLEFCSGKLRRLEVRGLMRFTTTSTMVGVRAPPYAQGTEATIQFRLNACRWRRSAGAVADHARPPRPPSWRSTSPSPHAGEEREGDAEEVTDDRRRQALHPGTPSAGEPSASRAGRVVAAGSIAVESELRGILRSNTCWARARGDDTRARQRHLVIAPARASGCGAADRLVRHRSRSASGPCEAVPLDRPCDSSVDV